MWLAQVRTAYRFESYESLKPRVKSVAEHGLTALYSGYTVLASVQTRQSRTDRPHFKRS